MPKTKFFKFTGEDGKKYTLSLKEKLFVEYYLNFRGNGVDAIYEAGYKAKNRLIAAAMAYENLIKPHISAYVNIKLKEYGFTDEGVEKQHLFLLNQFGDLSSKRAAVDMFYKLKGKYAAQKVKFIDENEDLTEEQIDEELARRQKLRKSGKKFDN